VSVGSSEAEVRAAFPRLTVEPHKYTDGRYLNAKLSPKSGVVFETDKIKVTRFRLGTYPAVEYVEGCY
jgi:hypothetical protein